MRNRRAGIVALAATLLLAGCQLIWPIDRSEELNGQSPGPTARPLVVTTPAPAVESPGTPAATDGPPVSPTPEIPPPID